MAQLENFAGAQAIVDTIKTTLGPKGMDKILQGSEGSSEVTNDGATILKKLFIDNPAAKVLIDIAKIQDEEVGDGTTSVVVFAGYLLQEGQKLIEKNIHPMTIIAGYRDAQKIAVEALKNSSADNSKDDEKFREDLFKIASTTISSKILQNEKEKFATLAVDAIMRVRKTGSLQAIQILKKPGGTMKDSFLDEGFILDKQVGVGQPTFVKDAKILVANTAMDTDKIKIYGAKVKTNSIKAVAEIEQAEKDKMRAKCEKIKNHGINVFINRQLIYDFPQEFFSDNGIVSIEHADFEGVERLALVLGAEIASTFDHPEEVKLGRCAQVSEVMIGEDRLIKFSGCAKNEACTIVLRGANSHLLDECERSLHDALCVLQQTLENTKVVYGGGCSEMLMAKVVSDAAKITPGKKALAMEAFATALKLMPATIADNAGLDSAELISLLEACHYNGQSTMGIDVVGEAIGDVQELGILESLRVKQQYVTSATEAAEMILRVDNVLRAAPRQRRQEQ